MKHDNIIATPAGKVVYRDGDQAVKVFDESYKKSDVLNEALNTARVEETGLAIPQLIDVQQIDGKWAIITEYIPGKTLAQLMEENPEKEDEYLELFVDLQLDMHKHTCPMLNMLTEKMNRKIDQTKLDATMRYELHARLASMHVHKKLCHGDFNPSNIIITPEGKPYIIDWAHATQGNASADTARTYLLFCMNGDFDLANKYLDLFCRKSDTARQYVQKWMPIVAASQLSKSTGSEHDFLLKWVDVVDYQ